MQRTEPFTFEGHLTRLLCLESFSFVLCYAALKKSQLENGYKVIKTELSPILKILVRPLKRKNMYDKLNDRAIDDRQSFKFS